jgi:hypothetical protein
MSAWSTALLDAFARAGQVRLAVRRPDGSARDAVTVGLVRVGGDVFVRSYRGADGAWYRAALASGRAHVAGAGLDLDVALVPDATRDDAVDAAFPARYGTDAGVRAMVAPAARATTLRLEPVEAVS